MRDLKRATDTELLQRIARDDGNAYAFLFRKYWRPLYEAAFRVLLDEQRCEDIVQEVFMQLWDKRKTLQIHTSFKSYLYSIVRYRVFYELSESRCRAELFENIPDRISNETPETVVTYSETERLVMTAVERLPQRCKAVYTLSRVEELSQKEIAERLGISIKTVENQITKALRAIRVVVQGLLSVLLFTGF